jgi:hypothetical protein
MKAPAIAMLALSLLLPRGASTQDAPVQWRRAGGPTEPPVTVFHSMQAATLPTAETLRKGELLFEISHRFWPAMSEGAGALWGLDGPVTNRIGLAYAPADRIVIGVVRSNLDDNVELDLKARLFEAQLPLLVGVMGGVAFNTDTPAVPGYEDDELQAYAQLILDVLVGGRLALGLVPTYLHNPRIADASADDTFVLGVHGTLQISAGMSAIGEWIASEARPDYDNAALTLKDALTAGIQLETGGHFFKLLVTNSTRLNPTQVLAGTPHRFVPDEWRFGFNLTRRLALGR